MTDPYDSWFKAPVRKGVLNQDNTTIEFDNWTKTCTGKVVVTRVLIEEESPYPVLLPVFELEEDKVAYLLTWTEPLLRGISMFYGQLSKIANKTNSSNPKTRYDL